ncbi:MAG: CHAT domain-containing tetratricopeptide repeat protein, partial [Bacteroidota bacterium]
FYNSLGQYHSCVGEYQKMKAAYHEAYEQMKKVENLYPGKTAWSLVTLASGYLISSEYWQAIEYNLQALPDLKAFYKSYKGEGYTATVYNNLGYCYNETDDYDLAIQYLSKAIDRNLTYANIFDCHPGVAANFKNIAKSNLAIGDLERAQRQLEIALQILENRQLEQTVRATRIRISLVNVLLKRGEVQQAENLLQKAMQLERENGREDNTLTMTVLYEQMGQIHLMRQQGQLAAQAFSQSTALYEKGLPGTRYMLFDHQLKVGSLYVDADEFSRALTVLQALHQQVDKDDYHKYKRLCLEITNAYIGQQSWQEAAHWLAITRYACRYKLEDPERLNKRFELDFLTDFLLANARYSHARFVQKKNPKGMDKAILYLEDAVDYLIQHRSRLRNSSFIHNAIAPLHEFLIQLYQERNSQQTKELCFRQFEQSKALRLLGAAKMIQSKKFATVPDETVETLNQLESKVNFYSGQLEKSRTDSLLFSAKLEASTKELDNWKERLLAQHPSYYTHRYRHVPIEIQEVQKQLKEDQVVMEYFWGDKEVRGILITRDSTAILTLGRTNNIQKLTNQFLQSIRLSHQSNDSTKAQTLRYIESATRLYNQLFLPFTPLLTPKHQRITIIPDGPIGNIPFNAFLRSTPKDIRNKSSYDYLIHHFTISMAHSATLYFDEAETSQSKSSLPYLGFAPYAAVDSTIALDRSMNDRTAYGSLPFSEKEIQKGRELFRGQSFVGKQATKKVFLEKASQARILHCATHAIANATNGHHSHLLYSSQERTDSSDLLFVSDIYNIRLQAELVVLGACQSGRGAYERGEGVISLASAFRGAGAQSVCSTFWNLNDKASYTLLSEFFKNLKQKRLAKDLALRKAQLELLRQSNRKAHPYFWAVFSLYGNTDELSF